MEGTMNQNPHQQYGPPSQGQPPPPQKKGPTASTTAAGCFVFGVMGLIIYGGIKSPGMSDLPENRGG